VSWKRIWANSTDSSNCSYKIREARSEPMSVVNEDGGGMADISHSQRISGRIVLSNMPIPVIWEEAG
jgi:hypothetical protein